jgi:hypothetical protein
MITRSQIKRLIDNGEFSEGNKKIHLNPIFNN